MIENAKTVIANWWRVWRYYKSHWQNLRFFFSLTAVKFFVTWFAIAPIFVKVLEKLPPEIAVSINEKSYSIVLQLPFSWVLLWVASFVFTIALLIYYIRCPDFIKTNPSFSVFKDEQHSPRWLCWLLYYSWTGSAQQEKLAERLTEKRLAERVYDLDENYFKPQVEQRGTVWRFSHNSETYEVCIPTDLDEETQREYFWEIFGRWSSSQPRVRTVIWMLILVAIVIVLYVVYENIRFVLTYLLS